MLFQRFLLENMEWLRDELGDYDNDYIIIDCPGMCFCPYNVVLKCCITELCLIFSFPFTLCFCWSSLGQIELYSHFTYMRQLVESLQQWDFRVCGKLSLYLLSRLCTLVLVPI